MQHLPPGRWDGRSRLAEVPCGSSWREPALSSASVWSPLLVADGHVVAGVTRSPGQAGLLRELGPAPVVCDVFDAEAFAGALAGFGPEVAFYQLTDLPEDAGDIARLGGRNDRMRTEGTRNVLAAAAAAGTGGESR
jgi:uncharacterized protein YbjT (DUF2867 family)